MIFTSFRILVFISAVVIVYFILPGKLRWLCLLAASFYFYLSADAGNVVFLLVTTATTYAAALAIEKIGKGGAGCGMTEKPAKESKKRIAAAQKTVVATTLLLNFGILFTLKYYDFSMSSLSSAVEAFGINFTPGLLKIAVPVGVSFYIFQMTGYLIDVYRATCKAQRNPLKYALFASYFPQILQGPIGRYADLAPQLYEGHAFDYERTIRGLQRMVFGFFEKLVVADRLAIVVNNVWSDAGQFGRVQTVVAVFFYAIQIYADFKGYMDIALGLSGILGIQIAENFDTPYFSANIPEYWRRWHITLGAWFRDYLFYPVMRSGWCSSLGKKLKKVMGKAAGSKITTTAALLIVWSCTGLWHGAGWHFVAWGVYYGVLISLSMLLSPVFDLIVKRFGLNRANPVYKLFQIFKTFGIVCVGYVFFRSETMTQAFGLLRALFSPDTPMTGNASMGFGVGEAGVTIVAVLILFIVDVFRYRKIDLRGLISKQRLWLRWSIYLVSIFVILIFGIWGPEYESTSFIYFNF